MVLTEYSYINNARVYLYVILLNWCPVFKNQIWLPVSNFFQTIITPLSIGKFLNMILMFNLEIQGLTEYPNKKSQKSFLCDILIISRVISETDNYTDNLLINGILSLFMWKSSPIFFNVRIISSVMCKFSHLQYMYPHQSFFRNHIQTRLDESLF